VKFRARWACPDLGPPDPHGPIQVIPGSPHDFPDCPAYYLRTADVGLPAEHLLDGMEHPASLVAIRAAEFERGAITMKDVTPKVRDGIHIWLEERDAAREHARERERAERERTRANG
jgi:hypothetical protein